MTMNKTPLTVAMARVIPAAIPFALALSAPALAQDVDLQNFSNGFRIDGVDEGDRSGFSVSGAGLSLIHI